MRLNKKILKFYMASLFLLGFGLPLFGQENVGQNAIDAHFAARVLGRKTTIHVTDDLTFLRRVHLDLTGVPPKPENVRFFIADARLDKRRRAIEDILKSDAFTDRWTNYLGDLFWNQLLVIQAYFRNGFYDYLRDRVARNVAWDEIAREMLLESGVGYREGGSPSLYWAREAFENDFRLDYLDDQIGFITDTFLGVQTDCISCHDGAGHLEQLNKGLSVMKREQFWGMAAFLASSHFYLPKAAAAYNNPDRLYRELELVDLDNPDFSRGRGFFPFSARVNPEIEYEAESLAGEGMRTPRNAGVIQPRYLFTGEAPLPGETRRAALARMITADRQFARNMVNRIWAHIFGEGFVEPVNGWDLGRLAHALPPGEADEAQARDAVLMESLTDFFIGSGYDIRALMRMIANSRVYQADYENYIAHKEDAGLSYWTSDRRVRRLEAEAIVDSIFQTLGAKRIYVAIGMIDRPFTSTWSLPGSFDPNPFAIFNEDGSYKIHPTQLGYASLDEYLFMQYSTGPLLTAFGRTQRIEMIEREDEGNVRASLTLMNDARLHYAVFGPNQSPYLDALALELSNGDKSGSDVVRDLFRRALFREPTSEEQKLFQSYLAAKGAQFAVRDMAWALFNHPDFLYK